MITAAEAKQLWENSGQDVIDFFERHSVPRQIRDAANNGKRHVIIFLDSISQYDNLDQKISPIYKSAVAKLIELGYIAKITTYGNKYIPRGLQDDDGFGQSHQNFGIHIGW